MDGDKAATPPPVLPDAHHLHTADLSLLGNPRSQQTAVVLRRRAWPHPRDPASLCPPLPSCTSPASSDCGRPCVGVNYLWFFRAMRPRPSEWCHGNADTVIVVVILYWKNSNEKRYCRINCRSRT